MQCQPSLWSIHLSLLCSTGRPNDAIAIRRSTSSGFSSVAAGKITAVGETAMACRLPPMLMPTVFNGRGMEISIAVPFLAFRRYPSFP